MPYEGPTDIHIRGEDWIRDGSWFVKKSLVDQYGGDVENVPPHLVEQNRVSYPDGVNTLTTEQRAQNQGDPTGQDQFYEMRNKLGEAEFRRRSDLASSIGVNRSTDTGPRGVLADELFYGHMDPLPGTGLYFSIHGPGQVTFKDQNGNTVSGSPQLIQAAMDEQKNVDARAGGQGGAQQPTPPDLPAPPSVPAPTNTPPVKPTGPIFSKPQTSVGKTPPVSPPRYSADSLQAGVTQLPTAPMTSAPMQENQTAAPMGDTSIFKMPGLEARQPPKQPSQQMPNFMAAASGKGGMGVQSGIPQLPQAPKIGAAATSFKIG